MTILQKDELLKKQQLEKEIATGIESGKRGFQQAAKALLEINELSLWRDEANNFDEYRDKFRELLEDTDVSFRRLNQLMAAAKVVTILGTIVPEEQISDKESHLRPLTGLKNPNDVQRAYKTALNYAEEEQSKLKTEHVKRAVEEIAPPRIRSRKRPRPPIGAKVIVNSHYANYGMGGDIGYVSQHPCPNRCIIRFEDGDTRLIADGLLQVVEERKEITSVNQEQKEKARELGLRTDLQALPDIKRNEGLPEISQEIELAIANFLRIIPKLDRQQKNLVYEQLTKNGFTPSKDIAA